MLRHISTLLGLVLLLAAATSCGKQAADANDRPVRVMVAASAKEPVIEIAEMFTRESGIEVKVIAESSAKLATQIVNAAPADLFLSANEQWAEFVKEKGYAHETKPLLANVLVLIVPKGNQAGVAEPEDLTGARIKHVALAGPAVPAGIYARQSLHKLGLLDTLLKERKIVAGDDVRSTLAYVERGEADAGIVYDTDARITNQVEIVHRFDPSSHDAIVYPLVLLKAGQEKETARRFFEFMQSAPALQVFQKHGFTIVLGK